MSGFLPYGRHQISDADIAAVTEALRASHITQGPLVERFEQALAEYTGAEYAVAFNSGTAALHAAYAAAEIGPGRNVLTSPITFVATANAALYLGGHVAFADVDPATGLIDPDSTDDRAEPQTAAVVPVHFGGEVAPVEALSAIGQARGWVVIEDAAHAIGARYRATDGQEYRVGECAHSLMCCFSFHPVKQMTTGEGGAVTTNDPALYRRLKRFRTHGITREPSEVGAAEGPWYYEQHELGFNYRLTDFQSALGMSQLARLPEWIERRRAVAAWYENRLAGIDDVTPLRRPAGSIGAHHLFVVRVPPDRRRRVYEELVRQGVGANVHYIPVYHQPFYRQRGFSRMALPGAESYYGSALTLPLFPAMTEADVDRVVTAVESAVQTEAAA
ncbi:MAG: UDP-4-amino-4,6-dideoxy-N-acetyl-beta-L-altrosamine transaminase [Gemmatimonadales bacterium]|nr:UDP-4-amino-4,6-dideoxy-N-acetyl-beta-L-altrosamine transaminase [Gemmatimonadales bacterium]